MLSQSVLSPRPAFRKVFDKILFICQNTGFYNLRYFSLEKMAHPTWKTEKILHLNMSPEDRNNSEFYRNNDVITLDKIDPWSKYVIKNKSIETNQHTQDDLTEFKKIKINYDLNKTLAQKVSIFKGDITKLEVCAIANAANSLLRVGGGVDGAIHRAAGPYLQEECASLGGCQTGEAKVTGGYNLPAKYVIQTVGPHDGSAEKLEKCYENSLAHAKKYKLTSIAFPCISTGIYGFPNHLAAHIALRTTRKFLEENVDFERVIFCLFMPIDVKIYETLMQIYFPIHDWNYSDDSSVKPE